MNSDRYFLCPRCEKRSVLSALEEDDGTQEVTCPYCEVKWENFEKLQKELKGESE
jgi:transcription elongation factor Elf1